MWKMTTNKKQFSPCINTSKGIWGQEQGLLRKKRRATQVNDSNGRVQNGQNNFEESQSSWKKDRTQKKQCFYGINCWVFSKYVEQQSHNFLGDMFYYNLSVKYLLCFLLWLYLVKLVWKVMKNFHCVCIWNWGTLSGSVSGLHCIFWLAAIWTCFLFLTLSTTEVNMKRLQSLKSAKMGP